MVHTLVHPFIYLITELNTWPQKAAQRSSWNMHVEEDVHGVGNGSVCILSFKHTNIGSKARAITWHLSVRIWALLLATFRIQLRSFFHRPLQPCPILNCKMVWGTTSSSDSINGEPWGDSMSFFCGVRALLMIIFIRKLQVVHMDQPLIFSIYTKNVG